MMRAIVFNVSPAAPTVLTAVAGTGPTNVTLRWTNNWTLPAATSVKVMRATNSAFTTNVTSMSTTAGAVSLVDTSVVDNTQYYYRVRAENANSYSVWSNTAGSMTAGAIGIPLRPTNLTIGAIARTSIAITWVNPVGPAVTNNVVQYSTNGPNGPWRTAATLAPTSTSYTLISLQNNATFWIRVVAVNVAGSAPSAVKAASTLR